MSKKRRVEESESQESSTRLTQANESSSHFKGPLSAFAAAKARQLQSSVDAEAFKETVYPSLTPVGYEQQRLLDPEQLSDDGVDQDEVTNSQLVQGDEQLQDAEIQISNWVPTSKSIVEDSEHRLVLKLDRDQTLCCIGQYDLSVKVGVVEVVSATLFEGSGSHKIFAPSTGPLPVIKCLSPDGATVELASTPTEAIALNSFDRLSPLFRRIWKSNQGSEGPFPDSEHANKRTFSILLRASDDPSGRSLRPLIIPNEWTNILRSSADPLVPKQITAVVGLDAAGKGLLCRTLINSYLTRNRREARHVLFVDLDPANQELYVGGQITVTLLGKPLLNPAFTSIAAGPDLEPLGLLRASCMPPGPTQDHEDYFKRCALELMETSFSWNLTSEPGTPHMPSPIIVKFPELRQGSGSAANAALLHAIRPDMTMLITHGSLRSLSDVADACQGRTRHDLPALAPHAITRTHDELRDMCLLSYFHSSLPPSNLNVHLHLPLAQRKPRCLYWRGVDSDFLALVFLPDTPPHDKMLELLNGSLVSVVLIEDEDYALSLDVCDEESSCLPYLEGASLPTPAKSDLLGVALIRAVDTKRRVLEVLTMLDDARIESWPRGRILLVHGCYETPRALLLEDFYWHSQATLNQQVEGSFIDDTVSFARKRLPAPVPYVEIIDEDQEHDRREGEARWKSRKFNQGER